MNGKPRHSHKPLCLIVGVFLCVAGLLLFGFDDAKGIFAAPVTGGAFGPVAFINSDGNVLHPEPLIAIDPNNSNRFLATSMVFAGYPPQPNVLYYLSTDGGTTWSQGATTKSNGATGHIHGWVNFDNLGNGYLVQLAEGPAGVYMARLSSSNVWSLAYPVILDAPSAAPRHENDVPRVQTDRTGGTFANRVYMSWLNLNLTNLTQRIVLRYVDAANFPNWSALVEVSVPSSDLPQWPHIAVGADGAVYVAYLAQGTPNRILLAKSTNGGVSFTAHYTISVANRVYNGTTDQVLGGKTGATPQYLLVNDGPLIVAHPTDPNSLAVVWMDGYNCTAASQRQPQAVRLPQNDLQVGLTYESSANSRCPNAHIVASHSTDGGVTWSAPVVVNDDGDQGNRDHFLPALAVGADAILHVTWYDRRLFLNCTNPYLYNVVYSSSTDWGHTWSSNARVSSAQSDPANPNFGSWIYGNPTILYIGHYSGLGVTADGSAVRPAWTQTTLGVEKIATSSALTPVTGPFPPSACYYYLPVIMKDSP